MKTEKVKCPMWVYFLYILCFAEGLRRFLIRGNRGSWYLYWGTSFPVVVGACPRPGPPLGDQHRVAHKAPECSAIFQSLATNQEKRYNWIWQRRGGPWGCGVQPNTEQVFSNFICWAPASLLLLISCLAKIMLSAHVEGSKPEAK